MDNETKICRKCNNQYQIDSDDKSFYEKMDVAIPILCPECRFKRRSLFRNEIMLYNRKCDKCLGSTISVFNPDSPFTVYCVTCYESDSWDPYDYATEYDIERPFFEQFYEFMKRVPKKALGTTTASGPNINSDYTNVASANKNGYFLFNTSLCEDSLYGRGLKDCKEVVDMYFGVNDE